MPVDRDDASSGCVVPFFVGGLALPAHPHVQLCRGQFDEFANAVLLARGDHEIVRALLLEHEPLGLDKIARMAPIAARLQVPEVETVLQSNFDARKAARDLASDERLAAYRRLV